MKVKHLLDDLKQKQIFGRYRGTVWTIEYYGLGLPHLHLLLFLDPSDRDRLLDPIVVDRFVYTELPRPSTNPDEILTEIVTRIMIYGSYGIYNPQSPYIVAKALSHLSTYSKRFPKRF